MSETTRLPRIRFGPFLIDPENFALYCRGAKIPLQDQPFKVLILLLRKHGRIVTREELQLELWPADTFIDFEHSLNKDIHNIRLALGDSPDDPVYLETIARHGYRFIHPVEVVPQDLLRDEQPAGEVTVVESDVRREPEGHETPSPARREQLAIGANRFFHRMFPRRRKTFWIGLAVLVAAALAVEFYLRHRAVSTFPPIRSLAVLPLKTQGDGPELEGLSLQITDALINELGKISSLRVISQLAMMNYHQTGKTVSQIARELKVDGVIEGSVMQRGEGLKVSVRLFHASTKHTLWENTYETRLPGASGLEAQVTFDIAEQLKMQLSGEKENGKHASHHIDPEAYKLYLMGRFHTYQMTQDFEKDIRFFERSIEVDPSFAEPYAGMAVCYISQCIASKISPQEGLTRAKAAAQKALELDPNLAEAHAALGVVRFGFEYDWAGARQAFQKALELNPNSADIHINYVWYLVMTGQFEEAIAKNLKAMELDPLTPVNNFCYGWTCLMARRYDEGIQFTKKLLDQDPLYPHARLRLSELYAAKGMDVLALEGTDQIEKSQIPYLAWVYAVSKQPGKARALLGELTAMRKSQYMDATFLARGYAGLGDRDKAFAWLETAFQERSPHLVTLKVFPGFDGLRSDPRYRDLLERIGLAD